MKPPPKKTTRSRLGEMANVFVLSHMLEEQVGALYPIEP
jgi:hypothetical protein